MNLVNSWEILKNKKKSPNQPGYVDKIFEINERTGKDYYGEDLVFVVPIIEKKKEKKEKTFSN